MLSLGLTATPANGKTLYYGFTASVSRRRADQSTARWTICRYHGISQVSMGNCQFGLNTVACEILLPLPGCATSSSCSFM